MDKVKPHCTKDELIRLLQNGRAYTNSVEKALNQASYSHRFHCRDDGKSYLTQHVYPLTVDAYNYFAGTDNQELAIIVTLLHDVPEKDHYYTEKRLRTDFGDEVANHVWPLQKPVKNTQVRTQQDRHDEQVSFMEIIKESPKLCQIIKTMDRINNLACTEVSRDIAKYERFVNDTVELYVPLAHSVDALLAARLDDEIARLTQELHR